MSDIIRGGWRPPPAPKPRPKPGPKRCELQIVYRPCLQGEDGGHAPSLISTV